MIIISLNGIRNYTLVYEFFVLGYTILSVGFIGLNYMKYLNEKDFEKT